MKKIIYLLSIVSIITGCSKDKRLSNKIDGRSFYISNFKIDGQGLIPYDTLVFHECKIYKNLCTGEWRRNGGKTQFYWQINEKGKEMVISNITTLENTSSPNPDYYATTQCYNLSGKYEILNFEKKKRKISIQLKSISTEGYSGSTVEFTLISGF